jgi:hypothetical protein
MVIHVTRRRGFEQEQDLLKFAHSYLAEGFPNPLRSGCPPDDDLRILAKHPTESDVSVINHLTCCSPCFKSYMACLGRERTRVGTPQQIRPGRRKRVSLVTAGIAFVSAITIYLFLSHYHHNAVTPGSMEPTSQSTVPAQVPGIGMYPSVLVDLGAASPTRGTRQGQVSLSPQVIPSDSPVQLVLVLPLGTEGGAYSVRLTFSREVVWSTRAQAIEKNGQTLLRMQADFSHIPSGLYDLIATSRERRFTVPVLLKTVSPKEKRQ